MTIFTEFSPNANRHLGKSAVLSTVSFIKLSKQRYNNNIFAAVLTHLPKVFDCINHELLIDKLNAYGLCLCSLT